MGTAAWKPLSVALAIAAATVTPRTMVSTSEFAMELVVHVRAASADNAAAERAAATADGSASSPFPTIHAARDHLRVLRAAGGDGASRYRVVIGSGTYAPLQLAPEDSGSPGRPVIYEADRSDGPAVVSAGTEVPKDAFEPWAGHPGILKANLSSLNLQYGSLRPGGGCYGDCTG
jgi:hypothetical protein